MNRLRENFNGYNSRQNVYRYAEICHAITIIKTNKSLHPLACINGKQKPPFPSRPLLYLLIEISKTMSNLQHLMFTEHEWVLYPNKALVKETARLVNVLLSHPPACN